MSSIDQAVIHVVAPLLSVSPMSPLSANEAATTGRQTLATFADANADINALSATVSWGDGSQNTLTAANGGIVANTCYHIGQIVQVARIHAGERWKTLTIRKSLRKLYEVQLLRKAVLVACPKARRLHRR